MECKVSSENPQKYLRNLVRSEEIIDILGELLKCQKTAEMVFYPVFIEEIMDLLIDMKSIVEEYAVQYDKLETENTRLRYIINENNN